MLNFEVKRRSEKVGTRYRAGAAWTISSSMFLESLRVHVVATITLCFALVGCGSAPAISEMHTHAQCHVWTEGGMSHAAARVDQRAWVYGSFGEAEAAYFVARDQLEWPGTFGAARGTYRNRELTIYGALGDIGPIAIEDRRATVEGVLGDLEFEFNERCSDRQAAMGVMSLVVALASK
jgi:hypothetical protein